MAEEKQTPKSIIDSCIFRPSPVPSLGAPPVKVASVPLADIQRKISATSKEEHYSISNNPSHLRIRIDSKFQY